MKKKILCIFTLSVLAGSVGYAIPMPHDLEASFGINVGRSDWWHTIGSSTYPGKNWSGNSSQWQPLESQERLHPSDPAASIVKLANLGGGVGAGPIVSSQSIYFLGSGTVGIVADQPLDGVRTVFLQLSMGEAYGETFVDGLLPQLQIRQGAGSDPITIEMRMPSTGELVPMEREYDGKMDVPPPGTGTVDNYINLWGFQWDIPALYSNISEISVSFSAVPHVVFYQAQLDQSTSVYNYLAIPEPGTYALLLGGAALAMLATRRRLQNR